MRGGLQVLSKRDFDTTEAMHHVTWLMCNHWALTVHAFLPTVPTLLRCINTEMIEELAAASNLLNAAIERYLTACLAIQNCFNQGGTFDSTPQELANCVASEFLSVTSFETKIQQARVAISLSRNRISTLVSINTLPSEILGHIFHLVIRAEACINTFDYDIRREYYNPKPFPYVYQLDLLSHVCSSWRKILIGSHALWSHVDLSWTWPRHRQLLARAEACAVRAGRLPLDIHILGSRSDEHGFNITDVVQFLASVTTRIGSLELVACDEFEDSHGSVLSSCLAGCVPGTLTQLSLLNEGYQTYENFLEDAKNPYNFGSQFLNLSQQDFEALLLSTTVLRLRGMYPHWTSQAYHGLVELRLCSFMYPPARITQSQLVGILTSSPGLRVFHLGLDLMDDKSSMTPIRLDDLEEVNFMSLNRSQLATCFQLLAPGAKPLQVFANDPDMGKTVEVKQFFARSNVAKLQIRSTPTSWNSVILDQLSSLSPHLHVLTLQNFDFGESFESATNLGNHYNLITPFSLNSLHLLFCVVDINKLLPVVKRYSIQTLVFWSCRFSHEQSDGRKLQKALSDICPVVKYATRADSVNGWE
jgi:hypothetical protein